MGHRHEQRSMAMSVKQRITAEQLMELPEVPGKRFELVNGELVEMSPAGAEHTGIMFKLAQRLDTFVSQHDLGVVLPEGLGFVLRREPDLVREPDVSFVVAARVPDEGLPKGYWDGPPTLAIEVVSPNDRADDIQERVQDYLEAGSKQVWVLWPRRRSVTVYSPDGTTPELGPDATLDGGDILPGFRVTVGDLFETRRRR
jgi:Uma2 family endonuclease